jgi:uncharacterized protein YciI
MVETIVHNRRSLLSSALAGALLAPWAARVKAQTQADPDSRPWWFVFLETGRKTPDDKAAVQAMQVGHIDNFKRLHGEKKLFAAGPLRDPSGLKRGIVVVRAESPDMLASYFQPDAYVREGYMVLNAAQATVHKGLISEGIDPNGIEEVRIVLVPRPAGNADAAAVQARHAQLRRLLDDGTLGAWYTLHSGPWAELLFARSTDTAGLQAALAAVDAQVWQQWIGKGVVPGPRM